MTTPYYHKTIKSLEADGLIQRDGDTITVTPKGDEWTRALIRAYPNIPKARKCKTKPKAKAPATAI